MRLHQNLADLTARAASEGSGSRFGSSEALGSFKLMFEEAKHIPMWLISYNDRSFPDIDTMVGMIEPYKRVRVEHKKYSAGRGGKGSVAGSSEILFVCTDK